jgi:DNA processing protein
MGCVASPVSLTQLDPRYPSRLVGLSSAPASIRWQGGPLEAARAVAVVGARHARDEAVAFASEIASALVQADAVVVSGGAVGIDAAAHTAALAIGGRTWAVAGTDPSHCYPASHSDLFDSIARGPGAMLWPFEGGGNRGSFLARNQVLVALADAVVVVQAGLRSGAVHAASCAKTLGKPLWVVPAAPWMSDFAGSLKLIDEGARVLTSVEPLLRSLPTPHDAASTEPLVHTATDGSTYALSVCESAVLDTISQRPLHIDAIVAKVSQSAQAVTAALLTLALENVVVEGPPGLFRRRRAL